MGGGLHVSDDVKIRDDLPVFGNYEAATQDITGISRALDDDDRWRNLFCDLSSRECDLPKYHGHDQQ
jgi:hypothetical protein